MGAAEQVPGPDHVRIHCGIVFADRQCQQIHFVVQLFQGYGVEFDPDRTAPPLEKRLGADKKDAGPVTQIWRTGVDCRGLYGVYVRSVF